MILVGRGKCMYHWNPNRLVYEARIFRFSHDSFWMDLPAFPWVSCLNLQGVSDKLFRKKRFAWSTACHWSNIDRIKSTKYLRFLEEHIWFLSLYSIPKDVSINSLGSIAFRRAFIWLLAFSTLSNPEKQIWGSSCKPVKFLHLESAKPNPWWHCRL